MILFYELLPGRRSRLGAGNDDGDRDSDDPSMTVFDALGGWFTESKASLSIGVLLLSWGTYLASSQDPRSTFICSSHDRSLLVVSLQWVGLLLDASVAVLMWRILAWARTTRGRLRTLSGILLFSSLAAGLLYWTSRLFVPARPMSYHFRGLGSLYLFDIVVDGLVISVCLISTSLLTTEGSPLSLVGIVTFLCGLFLACRRAWLAGTWENVSPSTSYCALILVSAGFAFFVYANNIRSVVFVHRAFAVTLLVALAIAATIYTPIQAGQVLDEHPLAKIIYDARVEADRWLIRATVSNSLPVAVEEYRERHNGRDPPPKFDIWYNFARERKSVILDHFPQMEKDLLPFWGISPSKIREDVRRAAEEPDIAMLQIRDGKPRHNLPPASPYKVVMDDLVDLVKAFSVHLPDMELAINLDERPRVLAPWDDVQRFTQAAARSRISKLLPRTSDHLVEMPVPQAATSDKLQAQGSFTPVRALREMTALTCPPGTKARSGTHWDIRDLCTSCVKPQSHGQFLTDWPLSQKICHQSDILRLHSFFMTPPQLRPLQELLPIFSRAKTDSYSDILIPLRRISEEPPAPSPEASFDAKQKKLFWRGRVERVSSSRELLRGGHQERLVHVANTAARSEQTRLLLPTSADGKSDFAFEQVPTADLNALLPMDVAFASYTPCKATAAGAPGDSGDSSDSTRHCDLGAAGTDRFEFATRPDAAAADDALRHQYVLAVDTDEGPPRDLQRTLASGSVPFYASVFREWFSDRLLPWVHFVPVDLRFHALHSTLAYFVGIEKEKGGARGLLRAGSGEMAARQEDGRWIAEQGKRWAERALRREDKEVYLFRLLLEWGRVIDDNRDEIGFVVS